MSQVSPAAVSAQTTRASRHARRAFAGTGASTVRASGVALAGLPALDPVPAEARTNRSAVSASCLAIAQRSAACKLSCSVVSSRYQRPCSPARSRGSAVSARSR